MNAWRFGLWGWALLCAPVMAQQAPRCQQGRDVALQATPCIGGGMRQAWRVAVHPPPVAEVGARVVASRFAPRKRSAGRRRVRGPRRAKPPRAHFDRHASCESVRAQRAAAYEAVGLRRDFAMSSLWDNRVQQACK